MEFYKYRYGIFWLIHILANEIQHFQLQIPVSLLIIYNLIKLLFQPSDSLMYLD
jgi:hypothetical protein